jgi:hypothetical protein
MGPYFQIFCKKKVKLGNRHWNLLPSFKILKINFIAYCLLPTVQNFRYQRWGCLFSNAYFLVLIFTKKFSLLPIAYCSIFKKKPDPIAYSLFLESVKKNKRGSLDTIRTFKRKK